MWRSLVKTRRLAPPSRSLASVASSPVVDTESDVVIVGGGVVGTSIAYHLAKYGAKNVILLEKTELTAGSTWHAAGLVTYFNPGINLKKFHQYSLDLYKTLYEETGASVGLHEPGSIRICTTPQRMDEAKYQQSRQNWHPGYQKIITPEEIAVLHPLLNMDGILGGIHTKGDGHIDPYSVTMALAKGARQHGTTILQHTPALSLHERADGSWDVATKHGTLHAKTVVNCTGFWGRELIEQLGVDLPLVSIEHQYVITNSIPDVQALPSELPVIRDLENSYYLRQERTGMLIGPYEEAAKMQVRLDWQATGVPPSFGKELFPSDVDRIFPHLEAAMERMPSLADAGIQNVTCGPICYAPDALPIVGPLPRHGSKRLPNIFVANGMSYGIAHGGGCGDYVARWILDGEPPYDLTEIDPSRYGTWTTPAYVAEKARESYGDNNLITHPYIDKKRGRNMRPTSLYTLLRQKGAQFGAHAGWEVPHWFAATPDEQGHEASFYRTNAFAAVKRECHVVMEHVGITDLSAFSTYEVSGPRARHFLESLCANSIPETGKVRVCHMLTPKAKVMAELTISAIADDHFYVVTGSGSELHDLRWMESYLDEWQYSSQDVSLRNTSDDVGVLGVAGPDAEILLQHLTRTDVSAATFPFMHFATMDVADVATRVMRLSFTGELGFELHVPLNEVATVYKALWAAGDKLGLRVGDVGTWAVNAMRLEKGFRVWGLDMNKDTNPLEAGLGFFVKVNKKTPYIGQAAVQQIAKDGPARTLVMLDVHNDPPKPGHRLIDAAGNEAVWSNGRVVGNTTCGGYGHIVGKSIAFAYVPTELAVPGHSVDIELVGHLYKATIALEPFMDTQPTRVRKELKKKKAQAIVG
ncbi:dimethylglycine dehydrogenase [Saprolegnia diclina VS20]|uniref:Dimethylglycine dehydrogenase n=1 Tax=Saprolegnia diclina (strain VS20) TaxID=1156394 RepID=T0QBD2_SAPDV|nr:dimethylglycine dehydrogenase [Saprolegnia diclina VS20]EQC30845.1 dimethylglycine dehydrogenase [Saprolegnia diclina VS20]|eukprot:XP_008615583.1 dimethylglycine dehydrogenase [Saprolegnia diclina VS20]